MNEPILRAHFLKPHNRYRHGSDTILIELLHSNDHELMIVDCCDYDSTLDYIVRNQFFPRKVPVMVASHSHADHIHGFKRLIEHFRDNSVELGTFFRTSQGPESDTYTSLRDFLNTIDLQELAIIDIDCQTDIWYHLHSHIGVQFHYPLSSNPSSFCGSRHNNASIVLTLYVRCGNGYYPAILFPGDLELWGFNCLYSFLQSVDISRPNSEESDVSAYCYKIPHHGKRSSNYPPIVEKIKPYYAIITSKIDQNQGSIADFETLEVLDHFNSLQVLSTAQNAVVLEFYDKGNGLKIITK